MTNKTYKACIQGRINSPWKIYISGSAKRSLWGNSLHFDSNKIENSKDIIRELLTFAEPAQFGRGQETMYDQNIRNTWEIKKHKIYFDNIPLYLIVERIYDNFAPDDSYKIELQLHNLLIYETGQFFKEHRDAEKTENMIGTVIVSLPIPHQGGNMIIRHNDEEFLFTTQNTNDKQDSLSFVAFYGDCPHEILPVTSGYRVVLTYNMILHKEETLPTLPEKCSDAELKSKICKFIESNPEVSPKYIILDHLYSEINIQSGILKGKDVVVKNILNDMNYNYEIKPIVFSEIYDDMIDHDYKRGDYEILMNQFYNEDIEINQFIQIAPPCILAHQEQHEREYSALRISCENTLFLSPLDKKRFSDFEKGDLGNQGVSLEFKYQRAAFVLENN